MMRRKPDGDSGEVGTEGLEFSLGNLWWHMIS